MNTQNNTEQSSTRAALVVLCWTGNQYRRPNSGISIVARRACSTRNKGHPSNKPVELITHPSPTQKDASFSGGKEGAAISPPFSLDARRVSRSWSTRLISLVVLRVQKVESCLLGGSKIPRSWLYRASGGSLTLFQMKPNATFLHPSCRIAV